MRAVVAAVLGEEARASAPNLMGLLVLFLVGMLAALEAFWLTIPGALLSVLALRVVGRVGRGARIQQASTASRA